MLSSSAFIVRSPSAWSSAWWPRDNETRNADAPLSRGQFAPSSSNSSGGGVVGQNNSGGSGDDRFWRPSHRRPHTSNSSSVARHNHTISHSASSDGGAQNSAHQRAPSVGSGSNGGVVFQPNRTFPSAAAGKNRGGMRSNRTFPIANSSSGAQTLNGHQPSTFGSDDGGVDLPSRNAPNANVPHSRFRRRGLPGHYVPPPSSASPGVPIAPSSGGVINEQIRAVPRGGANAGGSSGSVARAKRNFRPWATRRHLTAR